MSIDRLVKNLNKEVTFRSKHPGDSRFFKGILTSITTPENAKINFIDLDNYYRVIKNIHHDLPDIKDLAWFTITTEDKKHLTFAFEFAQNLQFLNDKSYNFSVNKIGEADREKILDILRGQGYSNVTIK